MEISTSQKQQQHLTLTPSLRLALEVLRMPLTDLQTYLHQQLEENPLLERLDEQPESPENDWENQKEKQKSQEPDSPQESLWRENDSNGGFFEDDDDEEFQPDVAAKAISLHDHLLHQLNSFPFEHPARQVTELLIGWLDPDGYLRSPLEEISKGENVPLPLLEQGLKLLQSFDPPGIGARTLPECLLIQLIARNHGETLAAEILKNNFDLLAKRKFSQLALRLKVSMEELRMAVEMIVHLDPKPARNFSTDLPLPITPDLVVKQLKSDYEVDINEEDLPKLSLNAGYRSLLRDPGSSPETKDFIRQKMQQGSWLLKAISQRKTTLLAIAKCVVKLEKEYFTSGVQFMRALTQEEVAGMVGCHPSTVSRAISNKTIQTPYGILPMETFFGGGIEDPADSGKRLSPQAIQAEIESLIAQEQPGKPLSDQALAKALVEKGYPVARRTVAKYRTQLNILPAHFRQKAV